VHVLDLSRILSGPFATMTLADLGAEVIKVEGPGQPDETRNWGPPFLDGESTYFLAVNRSKLGVTLDFKKPRGLELLHRLLARADVLIENFRPGALERLGLGYELLAARYPRLVYCSISGYGHDGPRRAEPGFDVVIQGESGVMSVTGDANGPPFKMGVSIADIVCGMYAVQGILAALYQRDTTGVGQKIDLALLDSMVSTLTYQSGIYFATGRTPVRMGNRHPSIVPYETFETADGHLNLGAGTQRQWEAFCAAAGLQDLLDDPRFATISARVAHYDVLRPKLAAALRTHSTGHWLDLLRGAGLPCGPVRTVAEALDDPQLAARGMIVELEHPRAGRIRATGSPLKLSRGAGSAPTPPPLSGQHNREVYCGILGLAAEELAALEAEGIV